MCYQCQRRNRQFVKYVKLHFDVATFPMPFISKDLIGEFHPPTVRKNKYALTVICMLMGYVFCVPLKTKTAEEVIQAYIDNIYSEFGGSMKILSDNGTEFKNKIFEQVAKELGVVHKLYTPPYHPASNDKIEGFHAFLKAYIANHVALQLEWDVLVPLVCAAYNFIPNEHSKESPFFLMFGRDPVLPFNTLLDPKIRYLGSDINILSLEAMKSMFEIYIYGSTQCKYPTWALNRVKLRNQTPAPKKSNKRNTNPNKIRDQKSYITVAYHQGLSESFKRTCKKYGIEVHLKGGPTIKNLLMNPKDKDPVLKRSGVIYRFKCNRVECHEEYIGESARNFGDRFKEHLKAPSPIHHHINISGHTVSIDDFSILAREDQNLLRTIKEAIYIWANNPSLNRNVGKFHLPHIWDEVLLNISELKLK